jgi:hypothetical protein
MRMLFVSNHDKNAWEGTEFEMFGDALDAAIALSVVSEGMPLVYNGQEAGHDKRLAFFDKDVIEWRDHPMGDYYRHLLAFRKRTPALWNAPWGARMVKVPNTHEASVLSFVRQRADSRVFAAFNLSAAPRSVSFGPGPHHGGYVDAMSGEEIRIDTATTLSLDPWSFRILAT